MRGSVLGAVTFFVAIGCRSAPPPAAPSSVEGPAEKSEPARDVRKPAEEADLPAEEPLAPIIVKGPTAAAKEKERKRKGSVPVSATQTTQTAPVTSVATPRSSSESELASAKTEGPRDFSRAPRGPEAPVPVAEAPKTVTPSPATTPSRPAPASAPASAPTATAAPAPSGPPADVPWLFVAIALGVAGAGCSVAVITGSRSQCPRCNKWWAATSQGRRQIDATTHETEYTCRSCSYVWVDTISTEDEPG